MKTQESKIQSSICDYLELRGYCFWRSNNIPAHRMEGNRMIMRKLPKYARKGIPDIVVVRNGQFIGLEVKNLNPKTYQSDDQKKFEKYLTEKGRGRYYVVRSIEDVQQAGL